MHGVRPDSKKTGVTPYKAGYRVNVTRVTAIAVDNQPGGPTKPNDGPQRLSPSAITIQAHEPRLAIERNLVGRKELAPLGAD